jgi:hypothetical protein
VPADLCPKCLLQAALPTEAGPPKTEQTADAPAATAAPGLPQPGEQLGHYRIMRLLGEGGMGAVFDAEDLDSGRRVALKVLGQKLDSPAARERFIREGRLAASINHPNSVYVFGTEEIAGTPVIAMELVAGGTLQERVQSHGPLPIAEAVDCVQQIIAGLEAAQLIGILHRDIKPSNCFQATGGEVKIGDFGLSISTAVRIEPALTATGLFLGTPAFCSPEQLRGDELNVRSDMYSVGATLFYLLTGRTPFEGKNTVQLMAAALEKRAPSPAKFRPAIPQGLAGAILRCLEKQPGDRFKNYQELALALAPYGSVGPAPAALGLRFLASVLDSLVLGFPFMFFWFVRKSPADFLDPTGSGLSKWFNPVYTYAFLAAAVLYYTVFEGWRGAALGKAVCRLRVVGPDRGVPGFWRAFVRALIFLVTPMLPFWLCYGFNYKAYFSAPPALQYTLSFSVYIVLALLFCTARRRNGFAALHDLAAKTRVISRAALVSRPALAVAEAPPPAAETGRTVGPYHVLETLEQSAGQEWLLGYDLRLLRKVWIRVSATGTPPVPTPLRNLGRVGRLRWLAGRRSPDEDWDAFEAPSGQPLLKLMPARQAWSQVRFWLYDLAREISAASQDGTLPAVLELDRVWITGEGRAKLLDFPAPGLASATAGIAAPPQACGHFLRSVATAALEGRKDAAAESAGSVVLPLPLHAREFLERLPQFPEADGVAAKLQSLLQRAAVVTRWRRAAMAGGCLLLPLFAGLSSVWGTKLLEQWNQNSPGVMDLSMVLQQHTSLNSRWLKKLPHPTDRQFAIFIASHYQSVVTNEAVWKSPFALMMIKDDARRFAERSVAEETAPTAVEVKEADAAIKAPLDAAKKFDFSKKPSFPFVMATVTLVMYVCFPALLAALAFRGGLVLLIARVTFVRRDGVRASRLRLFWRALVTWSPLILGLISATILKHWYSSLTVALVVTLFVGGLALLSVALPERGLQDRLAGTWPVPR